MMVLRYDIDSDKICLEIPINDEQILNVVKILVEKTKILEDDKNGLKIKLQGTMHIDFVTEELRFLF